MAKSRQGGYESTKPAEELCTPPHGPAPGAKKAYEFVVRGHRQPPRPPPPPKCQDKPPSPKGKAGPTTRGTTVTDDQTWSDTTAVAPDGEYRRLTWREMVRMTRDRLDGAERIVSVVSDLDRCPHGRHEQDDCSMCQAEGHDRNQGNPYLTPGTRVGTDLSGDPIVYPGPNADRDPGAWRGGKP